MFTIRSLTASAAGSSSLTVWTRPPMAKTILLPCDPRVTMSLALIMGKKVDWTSGCEVNRLFEQGLHLHLKENAELATLC